MSDGLSDSASGEKPGLSSDPGSDVDYYAVLGIEADASADELKAAYRRAVKAAHPDHGGTEGLFGLVREAGEHLLDPVSRSRYDSRPTDRRPSAPVADPWAGDWNDAAAHSPVAPPSFATPWWSPPANHPAPHTPNRPRRARRNLADYGFRASDAPAPRGVVVARVAFLCFVAGFGALRVFAAGPRDPALIDRLGLVWTLLPVIGTVAGASAVMAIRNQPSRFGGRALAWLWFTMNTTALIVAVVGGTLLLRTPL